MMLVCKEMINEIDEFEVHYFHIKLVDISAAAADMEKQILDTSWVNKISVGVKKSFMDRAKETIDHLVKCINDSRIDLVTEEFGEYLVSYSAQCCLEKNDNHTKIPLAEIFKDRKCGNSGYDFHTECPQKRIIFGEAKYDTNTSSYRKAFEQISDFIIKDKASREYPDVMHFISDEGNDNYQNDVKGYAAAFSLVAKNPDRIKRNLIRHESFKNLCNCKVLYIIGVEFGNIQINQSA